MNQVEFMAEEAKRCRRLMLGITDPAVLSRLEEFAVEYEQRAAELISSRQLERT